MFVHYFLQSVFVLVGILSLCISLFNPEWFFTSRNSQFIVKGAGRTQARIFYGVLGAVMIAVGIFFFLSIRPF